MKKRFLLYDTSHADDDDLLIEQEKAILTAQLRFSVILIVLGVIAWLVL